MFTFQTKLIAFAVASFLVLGLHGWLWVERANLKADLAQAEADVSICKESNKNWKLFADMANDAIGKLTEAAKVREKAAALAQKQAASASKPLEAHADALMALKPSGEACAASQRLIHDFLAGQK